MDGPRVASPSVRVLRSPGSLVAIAFAAVALPTVATGALPSGTGAQPARAAANTTTFQDSVGEDPTAPDITTIVVSNNDAGMISFRIGIPNRPSYTRDVAVFIFMDSDGNPSTGDQDAFGADHVIQLLLGEILLFRWDGADYTLSPTQTSLAYSWTGGATISVNASDLGNTRRFGFDVTAVSGLVFDDAGGIDPTNAKRDFAPAVGFYTYEVKLTPPTLLIRRLTPTPARPTAARPFTLRLVAARSDTGAVLQNGRVTCVARAGTTRLRAKVARVTGGAAVCTWLIPANAKGKKFTGSVAVVFEGLRASRSYSQRIR